MEWSAMAEYIARMYFLWRGLKVEWITDEYTSVIKDEPRGIFLPSPLSI
jgi:hypothetical protein